MVKNSEIVKQLNLNRCSVFAVVKCFKQMGNTENNQRTGRKRKLDARDERKLFRLDKKNRSLPLSDITAIFVQ